MTIVDPVSQIIDEGFCLLPAIIPSQRCGEIADRISSVVDELEESYPGPENIGFVPGLINHDQSFAEYLAAPPLLDICRRLLGHNIRITFTSAIVNHPGNRRGDWHSDWPFNQGNAGHVPAPYPDRIMHLTTLWMITEFSQASGATLVVPGSHRQSTNPTSGGCETAVDESLADEQHACGAPGTVLVFDSRLWHSAAPNTTDSNRIALAVRYGPWWLNTEVLRPGSDTRQQMVTEPELTDNQVPSVPRDVYDRLPQNVQPLYRHWIEA
ncbi:MAG: phytanoyl-CoA dioxygenase family protein [Planctomycetaceae bacterium]